MDAEQSEEHQETNHTTVMELEPAPPAAVPERTAVTALRMTDIETYNQHIRAFNLWLDGRPVAMSMVWTYFRDLLTDDVYEPATLQLIKVALKRGILESYPRRAQDGAFIKSLDAAFKKIVLPIADSRVYREELLNREQVEELIEKSNGRFSLIVETLYWTGLRISELRLLKLKRGTVRGEYVYFHFVGKRKKERRIFIPQALYQRIRSVFGEKHPNSEFLFPAARTGGAYSRQYLWREIMKLGRRVLQVNIHPHTFRHVFATEKIEEIGSTMPVTEYLGHSDPAITEKMYNHRQIQPEDIFGGGEQKVSVPEGALVLELGAVVSSQLRELAEKEKRTPEAQAALILEQFLGS